MSYFDEVNKLADLVLQWWKDHRNDTIADFDSEEEFNKYHEEPEFVVQARKVKECE